MTNCAATKRGPPGLWSTSCLYDLVKLVEIWSWSPHSLHLSHDQKGVSWDTSHLATLWTAGQLARLGCCHYYINVTLFLATFNSTAWNYAAVTSWSRQQHSIHGMFRNECGCTRVLLHTIEKSTIENVDWRTRFDWLAVFSIGYSKAWVIYWSYLWQQAITTPWSI